MSASRSVLVAVAISSGAAWAWLVTARAPHVASFGATFLMWNVMMTAMMVPPALPWFAFLAGGLGPAGASSATAAPPATGPGALMGFATAYASVWVVYCGAAAALQTWLQAHGWLTHDAALSHRAGGVLMIVAGLYQFSPLKAACLRHCRSPLGYLLTHWRDDAWWTLRAGVDHGLHCLGCCWALMLLAFAAGVMNLQWMAVVTLAVAIEQLAPGGVGLGRWLGAVLVVVGVALVSA
ncbi:MAG: DUF2182 domain-containing protein [Vicinamibacterales bacterium]